jgi:agmatinase
VNDDRKRAATAELERRLECVERSRGVALLGVPWDAGSSFLRGAALAPPQVRRALYSDAGNLFTERGRDLSDPVAWVDLGDLALSPGEANGDPAPESTERAIEGALGAVLDRGLLPLAVGGDHLVTLPALAAVSRAWGPVDVLVFDAHPDLYESFEGASLSHACVFARAMERGLARRLVQMGVRATNAHQRAQAERYGVEVVEMRRWSSDALQRLEQPLYVSVDLDVLDPAHAPGVAHREPGGATTRMLLDALQSIDVPVVGADVVELNPKRDPPAVGGDGTAEPDGGPTARVAAKLVKELAGLMLDGAESASGATS